jgi:serine/threonine protein kinase
MKNLEEHSYDVEKEWRREADAMKEFNSLGHRHVTRAIAAYTQNQKYYLVLEWADGGNLRDFWLENPHPQLTEEKIKEFIDQLWGLTDAIDRIHNSTRTALLRTRTAVEPSSPASSSTDHSSNVPALQLNGVNSFNEQPVASAKQDFAIIHEGKLNTEKEKSS